VNFAHLKEKFKDSAKELQLPSDFMSRIVYGALGFSSDFQLSFCESMNKSFGIKEDDLLAERQQKLKAKGIKLTPSLTNKLVVDAEYEDLDNLAFEFQTKGKDVEFKISQNDIEKLFNYLVYREIKEQTDEEARYTNIARSWGPLKAAIRVWLKGIFGQESNYYYRVFIGDAIKGSSSKLRPAITQALKKYWPILREKYEKRREEEQEREAITFTIQDEYKFTEDYKEMKQRLCVLNKCFLMKKYEGMINEARFIRYIDSKSGYIEWWFKNGDHGRDYFAIKYFNTREQMERLFYPDWIIKFKNGKIGIFDTKAGRTLDTEGRAKGLAERIKTLGRKHIGGIVKFQNGIFYYSNSVDYNDRVESDSQWILMEELFSVK
ncbi:hypothetical protein ACFL0P_07220, partial [Candidatus Omnitrophota bacterium]